MAYTFSEFKTRGDEMTKCILFDGDILVYKAGFSAELHHYEVVDINTRSWYGPFKLKSEAKQLAAELGGEEPGSVEINFVQTPKPFKIAAWYVDHLIQKVCGILGSTRFKIILSDDKNNFRKEIAKHREYKGNRKDMRKPVHYEALREYLINQYDAIVTEHEEADDYLGYTIYSAPDDYIAASIDKDLLMIPGHHYNIDKDYLETVTDAGKLSWTTTGSKKSLYGYGFKWFCAQMIIGDQVDNIEGIPKHGPVAAYKILDKKETCQQMWDAVVDAYKKAGYDKDRVIEIAQLLWIRRQPGEIFDEESCIPSI